MEKNVRGWIYIVGALVAGYLAWAPRDWADLVLALLVLVSGWHHAFGAHK